MPNAATFHYLTRGVIRHAGHVLLAQFRGATNTFLPGGHVEIGEAATAALRRELQEELGILASVRSFLGAVEHTWSNDGEQNFEINLVFAVDAPELTSDAVPPPAALAEDNLQFLWAGLQDLATFNLQPAPLVEWLRDSTETHSLDEFPFAGPPLWGSTIDG